jgi:hypothetical protein
MRLLKKFPEYKNAIVRFVYMVFPKNLNCDGWNRATEKHSYPHISQL